MIHNLILGRSMSGKTTLAKAIAAGLRRRGIRVGVLDCMRSEWSADYQTHSAEEFIAHTLRNVGRWARFVDESGSTVEKTDKKWDFLATTGRHLGAESYWIAHRLVQLSPTIREQCQTRFIFACNQDDADWLARDMGQPLLAECVKLPRFHFYLAVPFERPILGRVQVKGGKTKILFGK